jgi:hypothetical protein
MDPGDCLWMRLWITGQNVSSAAHARTLRTVPSDPRQIRS